MVKHQSYKLISRLSGDDNEMLIAHIARNLCQAT